MSWREIPGWTCGRLREWYSEIAMSYSGGRPLFVEIGVAYGASLAYLAEAMGYEPGARVIGVDIFTEHQGKEQLSAEAWARVTSHGNPMRACVEELRLCAAPWALHAITLVRSTGEAAADGFADGSVDVVFIDEHHTHESVTAAIRAWLPRVHTGGYLSGHDINDHYPGVLQAVRELLPGAEIRPPLPEDDGWGGVWTYRKP